MGGGEEGMDWEMSFASALGNQSPGNYKLKKNPLHKASYQNTLKRKEDLQEPELDSS